MIHASAKARDKEGKVVVRIVVEFDEGQAKPWRLTVEESAESRLLEYWTGDLAFAAFQSLIESFGAIPRFGMFAA